MKLLLFLTICFIIFELLKLAMPRTYWNVSLKLRMFSPLRILEFLYLIFLVYLFFVSYWYIGLTVFIASLITGFQLMDDVQEKTKFNKTIRGYLFVDGVVSIILLSVIIFKELLK